MASDLDEPNTRGASTLQLFASLSLLLSRPNIDLDFKTNADAVADCLFSKKWSLGGIHAHIYTNVAHLKRTRHTHSSLDGVYITLEEIRQDVDEATR